MEPYSPTFQCAGVFESSRQSQPPSLSWEEKASKIGIDLVTHSLDQKGRQDLYREILHNDNVAGIFEVVGEKNEINFWNILMMLIGFMSFGCLIYGWRKFKGMQIDQKNNSPRFRGIRKAISFFHFGLALIVFLLFCISAQFSSNSHEVETQVPGGQKMNANDFLTNMECYFQMNVKDQIDHVESVFMDYVEKMKMIYGDRVEEGRIINETLNGTDIFLGEELQKREEVFKKGCLDILFSLIAFVCGLIIIFEMAITVVFYVPLCMDFLFEKYFSLIYVYQYSVYPSMKRFFYINCAITFVFAFATCAFLTIAMPLNSYCNNVYGNSSPEEMMKFLNETGREVKFLDYDGNEQKFTFSEFISKPEIYANTKIDSHLNGISYSYVSPLSTLSEMSQFVNENVGVLDSLNVEYTKKANVILGDIITKHLLPFSKDFDNVFNTEFVHDAYLKSGDWICNFAGESAVNWSHTLFLTLTVFFYNFYLYRLTSQLYVFFGQEAHLIFEEVEEVQIDCDELQEEKAPLFTVV